MDNKSKIDLGNYEVLDLLNSNRYSLFFLENYKPMSNDEYLNLTDETTIHYRKEIYNLKAPYFENIKHPFEQIFKYTLSFEEIKGFHKLNLQSNKENIQEEIEKIYKATNPNTNYIKLIPDNENFIELKMLLFGNILEKPNIDYKTFLRLKYNLQYFKKEKNVNDEGIYHAIENKFVEESFLGYIENFFNDIFNKSKKQFKEELFKVYLENEYFDAVLNELLTDYRNLEKRLFKEGNGYFVPVIRLFRLKYINLFQWIISNFNFYLDKQTKKSLEIEVSPRDYITTFKLNSKKRLKVLTNLNKVIIKLVDKGYIDKENSERFKMLFQDKNKIDGLINWEKNIGTLYTFIKMLSDEGVIESSNIWEITARYIKVKNNVISTKKLRDSKYSKSSITISELTNIIEPII